jgi:hypothetical protein
MTQEALKLALEALITITDAIYVNSQQEADAVYKANDAITAIKEALAQQELNFCSRCGKRTADLTTIHTCTPPQENT